MISHDADALGAQLADIAVEAARLIRPLWRSELVVHAKADESPVSHTMSEERAIELAAKYGFAFREPMDSSIKFCKIAEGAADIYPRHGPTMEWDTAAGHAVLAAAGGRVTTPDGEAFLYGKADEKFRNGWFVARGGD